MITIRGYTLDEFSDYLKTQSGHDLAATVLHHTYRPTADGYRGLQTIRNIQEYHRDTRGWKDIGANAYAAPDGTVYNARPLSGTNYAHAYIRIPHNEWPEKLRELAGHDRNWLNRNAFGIETIGDFDQEDPKESTAMSTALDVIALVHRIWDLPINRSFFHRDISYKSCPGSRVTHEWVESELAKRLNGLKVVLLPGSTVVDCSPAIETGTARCDIRPIAEALGYEVIYHADQRKIYLRKERE